MTKKVTTSWQSACGKVILFGEHAVVYGARAIAAGIPNAVFARATKADNGIFLEIPKWDLALTIDTQRPVTLIESTISLIARELGLQSESFHLEIQLNIPHAAGLGASAAVAVASIRALGDRFQLRLDDKYINELAYQCEVLAHGTPSGLDNTLATYGGLMSYCRRPDQSAVFEPLALCGSIPLIAIMSGKQGYTSATVARIRAAWETDKKFYDGIFSRIDSISGRAIDAIVNKDYPLFAHLMNKNHQLLTDIGVSCAELEALIRDARKAGAQGVKLTGSGDGGAAIAYCGVNMLKVKEALTGKGWRHMEIEVGC